MDHTMDNTFESANRVYDKDGLCPTIPTCGGGNIQPKGIEEKEVRLIGGLDNHERKGGGIQTGYQVYDKNGVSPTLLAHSGGYGIMIQEHNKEDAIEIKQATKGGSIKCKVGGCFDASFPNSATRRGRVQEGGDVTPTITANGNDNISYVETKYRIRKLTPRECWRLMGYTDEDFDKASGAGVSASQLYKQAGNAIVKQVLMAIFKQMIAPE